MTDRASSVVEINLSKITFDESIYPRVDGHKPAHVQELFQHLESIEAEKELITVNQDYKILNGRHRHLAYLKLADGSDPVIKVIVVNTRDSLEDEDIAYEIDAKAALGFTSEDRALRCRKLYNRGYSVKTIAEKAKVSLSFATEATKKQRDDEAEALNKKIAEMWFACRTNEEISREASKHPTTISEKILTFKENNFKNIFLESTLFSNDKDFKPPIYNLWNYSKKSTDLTHFGNSEPAIVDNLLYLYTEPYDIVVDPFAGSGSTIDVCKNRLRRYWVSDRKPIVERQGEIRQLDIVKELPSLNRLWSDVSLTYLDPPYWKQAEGKYSKDAEDLANMSLEDFTRSVIDIVKGIASKQSKGAIALLIQPTQWKADNRQFTDHVFDIVKGVNIKKLTLHNRVSCPYSTQQYNQQQVNTAKDEKILLVLTRELIIWKVG